MPAYPKLQPHTLARKPLHLQNIRAKMSRPAHQRCRVTGSQKIALVASIRADLSAGGHSGLDSHSTIGSVIGRWLCGSYPARTQQYWAISLPHLYA